MGKRHIAAFFCSFILFAAGCGAAAPAESAAAPLASSSSVAPSEAPAPPTSALPEYDRLIETLNRELSQLNGSAEVIDYFGPQVICEDFGDFTLYRCYRLHSGGGSVNHILINWKESGLFQEIDLGEYWGCEITQISRLQEKPDTLFIGLAFSGQALGMGLYYNDFVTSLEYSISQNKITRANDNPHAGVYGYSGNPATLEFFACTMEESVAALRFSVLESELALPLNAPQINIPVMGAEGKPTVFQFVNTANSLSQEYLQQLRGMEGVRTVDAIYVDIPEFTGTRLTITPESNYRVCCEMNPGEDIYQNFVFRIFCIPAGPPVT